MKNEKTVPYNLRLPDKLKTKLAKQAKEESRSLNKHIVHWLDAIAQGKVEIREVASA